MISVTREQYNVIFWRMNSELSPYETFTNFADSARFGSRRIYTLWGLRGKAIPVVSNDERDSGTTYLANPKYLQ